MSINRQTAVNNYKAIKHLSNAVQKYFEAYDFSDDDKKELTGNPRQYAWKSFDIRSNKPEAFKYLPIEDIAYAQRYGSQLVDRIHSLRSINSAVDDTKSVIARSKEATKLNADSALMTAFPSMNWYAAPVMDGSLSVEKVRHSYSWKYEVTLPITWNKKVYGNGIAVVKGGDGNRFIMNAQERKLERINKEGIRAWAVVALKVVKKEPSLENAWVMSYENTSDDPILAVQKEFNKCESLLKRRIKDTVTRELLD